MKNSIIILATILVSLVTCAAQASHYVNPYSRHDGTYVPGHMSMDPGEARSSGYSYHHNQLVPNSY